MSLACAAGAHGDAGGGGEEGSPAGQKGTPAGGHEGPPAGQQVGGPRLRQGVVVRAEHVEGAPCGWGAHQVRDHSKTPIVQQEHLHRQDTPAQQVSK